MALYFLFREIYKAYYERQLAQLGERHYFENEDLVRVIGSNPVLFLLRFFTYANLTSHIMKGVIFMKTFIKNAGLFLAGGATVLYFYGRGLAELTNRPREGTVVYEDDKIKVTRMCKEKGKKVDVATIVYKDQTTNEES